MTGVTEIVFKGSRPCPNINPSRHAGCGSFCSSTKITAITTFGQTPDLFLTAIGQRAGIKPRQIHQASDAIRIYRYQYLGYRSRRDIEQKGAGVSGNGEDVIERLRHYTRSTEKRDGQRIDHHAIYVHPEC